MISKIPGWVDDITGDFDIMTFVLWNSAIIVISITPVACAISFLVDRWCDYACKIGRHDWYRSFNDTNFALYCDSSEDTVRMQATVSGYCTNCSAIQTTRPLTLKEMRKYCP